jgi:hypothetical protein
MHLDMEVMRLAHLRPQKDGRSAAMSTTANTVNVTSQRCTYLYAVVLFTLLMGCGSSAQHAATSIDVTVDIDDTLGLDSVGISAIAPGRSKLDKRFSVSATTTSVGWTILIPGVTAEFDARLTASGSKGAATPVGYAAIAHVVPGTTVDVLLKLDSRCVTGAVSCAGETQCDEGTCTAVPRFPSGNDAGNDGGPSNTDAPTDVPGPDEQPEQGSADSRSDGPLDTGGNDSSDDAAVDSSDAIGAGGVTGAGGIPGTGGMGLGGMTGLGGAPGQVQPPHLIAPLSTATVTSRRPLLRWTLADGSDGARVEICRDRQCTRMVTTFDAKGSSAVPPNDLPIGPWFWRAFSQSLGSSIGSSWSPIWEFTTGALSAPVQSSWGTTLDVNGDGFADVLVGAPNVDDNTGRAYLYFGGAQRNVTYRQTLQPLGASELFSYAIASAGDINGDGFADAIVGAYGANGNAGRAYIYLGSPAGLSVNQDPSVLEGPDGGGAKFGASVASAGDVNGDGYADVIVGAPSALGGAGRAYLYFGTASGISSDQVPVSLTGPDRGSFGQSVASIGDLNGDGYGDVIVGAPSAVNQDGRAYVYLGGASGLQSTQPTTTIPAPDRGGLFGLPVANAGDTDGDGYTDVVIGANTVMDFIGAIYLYRDGSSGLAPDKPSAILGPDGTNASFGDPMTGAGDLNGDGYADVAVKGHNVVHLYFGSASGLVPSGSLSGGTDDYVFGNSIASAGDVDADGYADLLVGASTTDGLGRVYIFFGSASGPSPPIRLDDMAGANGGFGSSIARNIRGQDRRIGRPSYFRSRLPSYGSGHGTEVDLRPTG